MSRERFDRALRELHDDILLMGSQVEEEMHLALTALHELNTDLAKQVSVMDKAINQKRFAIEDACFTLIATQQPAARDLRAIVAAMNMIVDLERMGDQAKGVAKVVPQLARNPSLTRPPEMRQMGEIALDMIRQTMKAYADEDPDLARSVAKRDSAVDSLFANIFTQMMYQMAQSSSPETAEAAYEFLRAARELERFADLATNIAERSVYLVTGSIDEFNPEKTVAA